MSTANWVWKLKKGRGLALFYWNIVIDREYLDQARAVLKQASADSHAMQLHYTMGDGLIKLRWKNVDIDAEAAREAVERAAVVVAAAEKAAPEVANNVLSGGISDAASFPAVAARNSGLCDSIDAGAPSESSRPGIDPALPYQSLLAPRRFSYAPRGTTRGRLISGFGTRSSPRDVNRPPLPVLPLCLSSSPFASLAELAQSVVRDQFCEWLPPEAPLHTQLVHAVPSKHFEVRYRERVAAYQDLRRILQSRYDKALAKCARMQCWFPREQIEAYFSPSGAYLINANRWNDSLTPPLSGTRLLDSRKCLTGFSAAFQSASAADRLISGVALPNAESECRVTMQFSLQLVTPTATFIFDQYGKTLVTVIEKQSERGRKVASEAVGELYDSEESSEYYLDVGDDDTSPADADVDIASTDFISFCETRLQDAAAFRSSCARPRVIGAQLSISAASVKPSHSGAIPRELWEELEGEHIVIYRKPTLLSEWF